ncbi:MAG: 3-deoxy-D-manno-octulosonate 8-phosphate phosphatase [Candidatus Omnitrophica bacterium]|nr:3-deoxy-D-manno-octulosonate 8-phosphate phosphatase [Candidatus Omnitrophota bacterium]
MTARASKVSVLLVDVDGVLTDGRIIYAEHGDELKSFDVQDGAGLVFWHRVGLKSAIISGRKSKLVKRRAQEMKVDFLVQGQLIKLPVYEQMLKRFRVADEQVCAICDDVMELPIALRVGLAVAVPNAVDEIKRVSHYVTHRAGGRGAVREVVDLILKAKGLAEQVLQRYQ